MKFNKGNRQLLVLILCLVCFQKPIFQKTVSLQERLDPDLQWNIIDIGVEDAWKYTKGDPEIIVAVIDSGIDFNHPDLINQSWINTGEIPGNGIDDDNNGYIDDIEGWDFVDNDNDPSPGHQHGTAVAGLIAADDDNNIAVGVAPNIKLMNLRILDNKCWIRDEYGDLEEFTSSIDYAVENGAHIIHLSIQITRDPPQTFKTSIQRAYTNEIVIVSVTGNYMDDVTYPGRYKEVIAVSATNKEQEIATFSTIGEQNEICAPGENIYSITLNNTDLILWSGTSFAAPLVTGTVALMLSLNRFLGVENIREILHKSSCDLGIKGKDSIYGHGLLNIHGALRMIEREYKYKESKDSCFLFEIYTAHVFIIICIITLYICIYFRKEKRSV